MSILPELRRILVDWLLHHRDRPSMYVDASRWCDDFDRPGTGVGPECWSIEEILYSLWDDSSPVPSGVIRLLDLTETVSFGELARMVHEARVAPESTTTSNPSRREEPRSVRTARRGRDTPHRSRPAGSKAPDRTRSPARS